MSELPNMYQKDLKLYYPHLEVFGRSVIVYKLGDRMRIQGLKIVCYANKNFSQPNIQGIIGPPYVGTYDVLA